ncbi:MAG TPA: antitoxin Xre/MbcA/ParS toxin-binding domain-containing protein [Gemmataceae bacterium]|nr:antitoxin Xre/MbcA/ParS toxin-binding domain-containing protein [Gemmataceae bacterium]
MATTTARKSRGSQWYEASRTGGSHGYVAALGLDTFDTGGLLRRIAVGLPFAAWTAFLRNSGLPAAGVAALVQLSRRTLARRKGERRLRPDESDRLVRAARLYAQAVALFDGDESQARRWLTTPQPALAGAVPLDVAVTDLGAREVEALIGRLEHGIPS